MSRLKIRYSQCWEDPRPSLKALEIGPEDDVLSIASGGDNSFALLLGRPRSLTVVDRNPAQLFLTELKIRAIEHLGYDELLEFVGIRPCPDRARVYAFLRLHLSEAARGFWDKSPALIRDGLLFIGKYERFFQSMRRYVLPLIHNPGTARAFLSCPTIEKQTAFYEEIWANRRWRSLFRLIFGKHLFGRHARDRTMYRHVTMPDTGDYLYRRTSRSLAEWPIRENPYFVFFLAGNYLWPESYPLWLQKENFSALKERVGGLRLKHGSLEDVLDACKPGAYSKFNLSNIFEYMSEEVYENTLRQLVRVSPSGGRLAFWSLFLDRPIPVSLGGRFISISPDGGLPQPSTTRSLYEDFWAWRIP
jgi:S-adenosylmethionine-diacylglycerol 3-amino-3-carboxypropyl transferase